MELKFGYELRSRDLWIKADDMQQENWALIEESQFDPSCSVYFIACGSDSWTFAHCEYHSPEEAKAELQRKGFRCCTAEEGFDEYFINKRPQPSFYKKRYPNGHIYSSGKFWIFLHNLVNRMLFPENLRVIGAMIGDICGSGYERPKNNIKYKPDDLITGHDKFTDDTVLTYAVAFGILEGMTKIDRAVWMTDTAMQDSMEMEIALSIKRFARKYPRAGYGSSFRHWYAQNSMERGNSWGNGSAMRASFAGWFANSLEEAELLGTLSARFTHGHSEGIKGAVVVAGCIYLLRTGHSKEEVREYASTYYNLNFTLDEIRWNYRFDVSCAGSVPQAIVTFWENNSFEEVIKAAISIGGDSDTIAAIAGSIAEAYYPIPPELSFKAWEKLDKGMQAAVIDVNRVLRQLHPEDVYVLQ